MNTVAIVVVLALWSNEISMDICIITSPPVVYFNLLDGNTCILFKQTRIQI
jgi:hypothetical protein